MAKILIVDDSKTSRRFLRNMLERLDMKLYMKQLMEEKALINTKNYILI